ncbi:MAG: MaoC family dehydratase N-terminal domain-containing protein [Chloroflexi bacterium]|nr:MaoC family dehydratase N-terminal domain-containing protein [Chloroflexota bacterium]
MADTVKTKITDEALAKLKSQVGIPQGRDLPEWELEDAKLLRSQIRSYGVMIGDMNPIFTDLEYAQKTRWGTILCHPGIINEQEHLEPQSELLPGCRAVLSEATIDWYHPMKMGDLLLSKTAVGAIKDVKTAPGGGRRVSVELNTPVNNQSNQLVGEVRTVWHCYERGSGAEKAIFGNRVPVVYNQDDIEALKAEYKREEPPRGADIRYWEDTEVGEELPQIMKGPTTNIRRVGGSISRWYWGHGQGWQMFKEHPELFFTNDTGAPEPIVSADWNHYHSERYLGVPGALECATERIHWNVHLLTDWMGDDGFLKRLDLHFPKVNLLGDVTRCHGRVKGKRVTAGMYIAEIEIWNENNSGDTVTTGTAEVILPSTTQI